MKLFEREYENRFGFLFYNMAALEGRKRIKAQELIKKENLIVFTSDEIIRRIEEVKEAWIDRVQVNGKTILLFTKTITFKSFSYISGYFNLQDLKEDFEFKGENEVEIMMEYIMFLRKIGLRRNQIGMYGQSGLAECFTYKGISQDLFRIHNNDLPKTEKERKAVFKYFENKVKENNGQIYGVLDCVPGRHKNVFKIDLNNFYGYLLCTQEYLKGNPYQVLNGKKEEEYGYLPDILRQKILQNYKLAHRSGISKGERRFFKGCNNLTIGRSENLKIYLKKTRTSARSFLQPQHGFETIRYGYDIMETYTEIFKRAGGTIVGRDTDAIWVEIDESIGSKIVERLNKHAVETLKMAGFSEEDANCGIGQFKIEGYYKDFYQFANKAYCFLNSDNSIGIKFAGLTREEKKEILEECKTMDEVIDQLRTRKVITKKPVIINDKFSFL